MRVKWLKLNNFRNYDNQIVEFFDGINLISGKNGQGKTNLVEAVMLSALTKSPRTSHDDDMRKENTDNTSVEVCVEHNFGDVNILVTMSKDTKKTFSINKNQVKKLSEVFGNLVAVYFAPTDLKIVSGGPNERREFMDTDISQLSGSYYNLIQRYEKVLTQRNKLLKSQDTKVLKDTIPIWNEQLARHGAKIILSRLNLIERLKKHAYIIHKNLTSDKEEISLTYQGYVAEDENSLKLLLLKKYEENIDKDIKLGYTTVGPHRDDIKIEANNIDLRSFGSQGQQRTASLTLKLAELEVFNDNLGEYPVLLLDDVLSELDASRQNKLLEYVSNIQTLVTCTDFDFNVPHTKYHVNNGTITVS